MAGVTIDIPGIGNVEAKNAATESTLREILKAIQKNGVGAGAPSTSGDASGDDKKPETLGKRAEKLFGPLSNGAKHLTAGFKDLTKGGADLLSTMANVGDSLESAASAVAGPLSKIPLVGGAVASALSAVAGAATQSVGAFQAATASGATFGGSINEFSRASSAAGMVMADFAGIIASNGEALRLLGGNTSDGAKRFASLSKEMRTSGFMTELNNLGYSTKDVNEGMAGYVKYLGQTGRIGGKSNAELAAGSAKYLKEMDQLAKITGETRKDQEEARNKLLQDAQYQAKISTMSTEAGEAFANTVNMMPKGLRDITKDIMSTGTATTQEAQEFAALMPESAAMMQKYAAITEAGGTITAEMQEELRNTMAAEGERQKVALRDQGKYNASLAKIYGGIVEAGNMQKDAVKGSSAAQQEAAEKAKTQAAALEESKRKLAEFSNGFTMALANSGMLSTLMTAFEALASFTQNIVVPAFQFLAPIVGQIVTTVASLLIPAFQYLGDFISEYVVPLLPPVIDGLKSLGGMIVDYVVPAFVKIAEFISDNITPVLIFLGTTIAAVVIPALIAKATALWAVVGPLLVAAAPFIAIGAVVALLVVGFQKLGGDLTVLGNMFKYIGMSFKQFFLFLKEGFYSLLNKIPGFRGDFDEDLKAIAEEREALAKEKEQLVEDTAKRMQDNRDAQKKKEEDRAARDARMSAKRHSYEMKGIGDASKAELKAISDKKEAEKKTSLDYNSPEASARSFFQQQKAPEYVKAQKKAEEAKLAGMTEQERAKYLQEKAQKTTPTDPKKAGIEKAETAKKTLETDAEAKQKEKEAAEKKAQEMKRTADEIKGTGTSEPAQESTESQLARLNNNMEELLRIQHRSLKTAERQLGVQEGLSGDAFAV